MPLYVLTAEILALHIRQNPNIKGIRPPGSQDEVKLSQYADDTSFTLRDDTSIQATFDTLALYEHASGAKINIDKCKGLWSGAFRHRTDQLLSFDWHNDRLPDKLLGTFFGNTDCTRLNIDHRLQSIRNTIAAWKHRDLSYKGKAIVINGLLTSTLWYTATSTSIPPWAITELETEIYNFFWDYKKTLISRDILALPLSEGGFNVQRIQNKIHALRLNTLRRLLSPEEAHWKYFTAYFLRTSNMPLGKHTLLLDYNVHDIDPFIPKYHRELLLAWRKHKPLRTRTPDPTSLQDILQEPIFCNPLIQIDNHTLRFPSWVTADLTRVKDLCYIAIPGFLPPRAIHELVTSADPETHRSFTRTTSELHQLLQAMPHRWKQLILTDTAPVQTTPQLSFVFSSSDPRILTTLANYTTRQFYLDILNLSRPPIPALTQWQHALAPPPAFNTKFWKNLYPPSAKKSMVTLTGKLHIEFYQQLSPSTAWQSAPHHSAPTAVRSNRYLT